MKHMILLAALLAAGAFGIEDKGLDTPVPVSDKDEKLSIAAICRRLVTSDMSELEWNRFILKAQKRYQDWSKEYDNDNFKHFLDDKLLMLAPGVVSGKGMALREFCSWLALYDLFVEPAPRYIADISDEDKKWIEAELADFDWNRSALKIKEKAAQR